MSNNAKFVVTAILLIAIVAAFLIGFSFERVRYDQYALLKNNFTQKLLYEEKFTSPGIFFIGLEKSFIKFPRYLIFNEFVGVGANENEKSQEETVDQNKVIYLVLFIQYDLDFRK